MKILRSGANLILVEGDGSRRYAVAAPGGVWYVQGGDEPVPVGEWFWPFNPQDTMNIYNGSPGDGFRTPQRPTHNGQDFGWGIANISGTPIKPIGAGTVMQTTGFHWSFGNCIRIDHGAYTSLYAHMVNPTGLSVNDSVTPATVLGGIGTTGNSTGNHLHLEIFDVALGDQIDPVVFMAANNPNDNVVP